GGVFAPRLRGGSHRVVVVSLAGDDDQGQYHVHRAAAHTQPLGHERVGDLRGGGLRQVERHGTLRAWSWLVTGAANGDRRGRAGPVRTPGRRSPPRTVRAGPTRPSAPLPGPGSATRVRPPPGAGTAEGRR